MKKLVPATVNLARECATRNGPRAVLLMVLLFGLSATLEVRATTFFGDISGNQIASGYTVGPGGGLDNGVAEGFTMTQTMSLTSVDIYLSQFQAASGSNLALSIFSDASGLPGSDLYDLSTNVLGTTLSTPTEATFSGTGSFTLNGGTNYRLGALRDKRG